MRLDVWLDGRPVPAGYLEALDNGAVRFAYYANYLSHNPIPLSLSLPLQDETFSDTQSRAFFDNLLPENDQLQRLIDRNGLSRDDLVGIMYHVGADCSGAVSCLPEGAPPVKIPGDLIEDYAPLSDNDIEAILNALSDYQRLPDQAQDPSPLAGVQGKIALTVLPDGQWALPKFDRKVPTTHILKVPARAEQDDVQAEKAACEIAFGAGFSTAVPEVVGTGTVKGLLSPRFDRAVRGNKVFRLHQEDFAQALGLPRRMKYQRYGLDGRGFDAESVRQLSDQCASPVHIRRTFMLLTLLNLAIGNNDNHAKNHALLYLDKRAPVLAPLYDLLPVRLSGRYTDLLSYDIGQAKTLEGLTRESVANFLSVFGLSEAAQDRFIRKEFKSLLERIEALSTGLAGQGLKRLDDLIGQNLSRLCEILDLRMPLRERDYFAPRGGGWTSS